MRARGRDARIATMHLDKKLRHIKTTKTKGIKHSTVTGGIARKPAEMNCCMCSLHREFRHNQLHHLSHRLQRLHLSHRLQHFRIRMEEGILGILRSSGTQRTHGTQRALLPLHAAPAIFPARTQINLINLCGSKKRSMTP